MLHYRWKNRVKCSYTLRDQSCVQTISYFQFLYVDRLNAKNHEQNSRSQWLKCLVCKVAVQVPKVVSSYRWPKHPPLQDNNNNCKCTALWERDIVCLNSVHLLITLSLSLGCQFFFVHADVVHAAIVFVVVGIIGREEETPSQRWPSRMLFMLLLRLEFFRPPTKAWFPAKGRA